MHVLVEMYLARHDGLLLAGDGTDRRSSCGYSLLRAGMVLS